MRNTAERFFKNEIFKKGYFNAPVTDLSGFKYGQDKCPICNETKPKFVLRPSQEYEKCCLDCFQKNDFNFSSHDSEVGIVTSVEIPLEILADLRDARQHVSEGSIEGLLKTPNFVTYQGAIWRVHCKDFMLYKGTLEPSDFTENSPTNNGKEFFLEITDKGFEHLWDLYEFEDNEKEYTWEDVLYHIFECKHCGKLRGYWELG
jgi:Uncharacterised protein family (UPF0167)